MKKKVLVLVSVVAMIGYGLITFANPTTLKPDPGQEQPENPCPPTANAECYTWANGSKSCFYGGEEHSLNCQ